PSSPAPADHNALAAQRRPRGKRDRRPVSTVAVNRATRTLAIDGNPVFPIVLTNPPPPGAQAPSGRDALAELAAGGASFIRTGRPDWSLQSVDVQIAAERVRLDAAAAQGLHCWPWLGDVANLPPRPAGAPPSDNERLLVKIVNGLKGHPALGVWKG